MQTVCVVLDDPILLLETDRVFVLRRLNVSLIVCHAWFYCDDVLLLDTWRVDHIDHDFVYG